MVMTTKKMVKSIISNKEMINLKGFADINKALFKIRKKHKLDNEEVCKLLKTELKIYKGKRGNQR